MRHDSRHNNFPQPRQWGLVQELFAELLAMVESEREAYLERTCADQAIKREVKSLLENFTLAEQELEREL